MRKQPTERGPFHAYVITNQINGKEYVGIAVDLKQRWRQHLYTAKLWPKKGSRRSALYDAMQKHGAENFSFEHVASAMTWPAILDIERLLILQRGTFIDGGAGYNMTLGGEGMPGFKHSDKALARMRGREISLEARSRISEALVGRKLSPEWRARISAAKVGKSPSPQARANMSAAGKGRKPTLETVAKLRAIHIGKKKSPEHRAKLRAANLGKKLSPERIAKMRSGLLRKFRSRDASRGQMEFNI